MTIAIVLRLTEKIILALLTIVSVFVNIGAEPTERFFHQSRGNCSYSIVIETTCAPSAETRDVISVRFGDSAGNLVIVKHLKNPKLLYSPKGRGARKKGGLNRGFERCAIDMFEASGACMDKTVCSLYVKQFGSDGWRPGWIKVLHKQDDGRDSQISYLFYFRTFVPENVWFGFDYCSFNRGTPSQVPQIDLLD